MKRRFLKVELFNSTSTCIIGEDFFSNGDWALLKKYASNRSRFNDDEEARKFTSTRHLTRENKTLAERIEELTKNNPLQECILSDICVGAYTLGKLADNTIITLKAEYANILHSVHGAEDQYLANDKVIVAKDAKGEIGIAVMLCDTGDLLNSTRNREMVKQLHKHMFKKEGEA